MADIFTTYIYQPFFNILIGIYWLLGRITDNPDMGIAVVIFAIIVRIIMLPINFSADRSEDEKRAIAKKLEQLKIDYKNDPDGLKKETKNVLKANPGTLVSEVFTITVQAIIVLLLYRIFKTGLEGADLHLIYPFMPSISTPINLNFLGRFDLSKTNMFLNMVQSLLIFTYELLHMAFSPIGISRKEFINLGIVMPLASFGIFILLPAGKKVFIITSLIFSIILLLIKQALFWYHSLLGRSVNNPEQEETKAPPTPENPSPEPHPPTN